MTNVPMEPIPANNSALALDHVAVSPGTTGTSPGLIEGTPPGSNDESYIDSNAVEDFSSSTFAQIREKSEMGRKSVDRTRASALGSFPEAVQALAVHDKIRAAYLERFGELSEFITDSEKKTSRILTGYDQHDGDGRTSFNRVYGQGA